MDLIHSFDSDGIYTGSTERPMDPVRNEPAAVNEAVATLDPLPEFDPLTQRAKRVAGAWVIEARPVDETESPPEEVPATVEQLLAAAKDSIRALRKPMLDAVTGIGWDATLSGDSALATEAQRIRRELLDITADTTLNAATTYEEMEAAGKLAYHRIARSAPAALAIVFKEIAGL